MSYAALSKYRTELMGAAMLWVMLFHARDLELGAPLLNWIRSAGFGGVDIFILLSSVGLVCSLSRRERLYTEFMARRASRVMPAYLAVMIPYTLWNLIRGTAQPSALFWNATLFYYWVRPKGAFNWYVSGAMLFYALTPAAFRFLKKQRRKVLWTGTGIVLGVLFCQLQMWEDWWQYTDFFYRVPVYFLGLLIGFYVWEDRTLGGKDILFWTGWFVLGMVYLFFAFRDTEGFPYLSFCHLFLFTTVPMCLVLSVLFEKLPLGWLRKFLRLVGGNSLEIYLLNVSLFSERELLHSLIGSGLPTNLFYLLMFGANIMLGLLLHRAVEAVRAKRSISAGKGEP